jgi:hypothetical protein
MKRKNKLDDYCPLVEIKREIFDKNREFIDFLTDGSEPVGASQCERPFVAEAGYL